MAELTEVEQRLQYRGGTGINLHQKILSRLKARRMLSERSMSKRYNAWNKVDENCRMFIDLSRPVTNGDNSTDSSKLEMPWARSIVVPMSYAILQVYLTQMMGIFTRRDPPLEIQGVGPEDVRPAKLMNAVIAYDQTQTNYILELYTALQDSFKYGMGGFHDCWEEIYGYKTERASGWTEKVLKMLGKPTSRRKWDRIKQYNKVEAFDPFNTWPDPRVSLSNLQNGEFFGHTVWKGYLELLAQSHENGGNYFNIEHVPTVSARQRAMRSRNRFNSSQMQMTGSMDEKDRGFHAVDSFVISIVPSDWELGDGDRPEKWQFTWVDDTVIIRAHPADYDHGQFNYSAMESNIDTHVFGNQGSIENMDGLQRFMNWKFNSLVQNHIRHLNNRMIYASSMVEAFDVENSDAGMHIRLTALGEQAVMSGRVTIPQLIHQLQLTDVMSPLMADINLEMDFMMRMSGAADQMMGRQTKEKRTLGEVQRVGHEGSARMAMHAIMMDVQCLRPLALRWCSNRQQYTDEEQFVRIGGNMVEEFGGERVVIKPGDLFGNYDYVPKTGPEPGDPAEMASKKVEALQMIGGAEGLLAMPDKNGKYLDVHELIKDALRDMGIKNVTDFYRAPQQQPGMPGQPGMPQPGQPGMKVVPDDQLAEMKRKGDVMPMAA